MDDAVAGLIAQLKVSEMLGLLDGDVPVREGLPAMSKEYNAVPVEACQALRDLMLKFQKENA